MVITSQWLQEKVTVVCYNIICAEAPPGIIRTQGLGKFASPGVASSPVCYLTTGHIYLQHGNPEYGEDDTASGILHGHLMIQVCAFNHALTIVLIELKVVKHIF